MNQIAVPTWIRIHVIDDDVVGWISENDIPALISKLRSTESCLSIRKPESSFYPPRGTEGDMAAYLVESFRRRIFPYSLYSREVDEAEKDNLERWWSLYNSATRVRRELKIVRSTGDQAPAAEVSRKHAFPRTEDLDQATRISSDEPNRVGDLVAYGSDSNRNGVLDRSEIRHVAAVIAVDAEGNTLRVEGREPCGVISNHHPSDQNPEAGAFKEWWRPNVRDQLEQ